MCGIAGIFAYRSAAPVDRDELRTIRDHMALRGPDGFGEWFAENGSAGLGHRRLSIIDLSARAAQPMASADGQLVVSFNGEIYNYRELKKELEARGRVFRTESDTEVLLHLYSEKGEAMLGDLRGMFAFALWDARTQSMLLARDPFGIKPLYYADDGKTFRFASQVKALLAGGQVDTAPEPAGHAGFFLWGSVPEPWTLYRGIRNLPAGHFIRVSQSGAGQPAPYCLIADILCDAADNPATGSRAEALEVFAEAFRDSIRAHQIADVPVGLFLSAGLDSAMIAAVATANGDRPHSMTLAFAEYAGTANDEAPMAELLAAKLGTRHATVMVRQADFMEDRERLLAAMDQPSIDGANTWFVSRAAASQGIKVALSGLGGDELLASYPSFSEIPRITRLASCFAHMPGLGRAMRRFSAPLASRYTSPKYASLIEYGGTLGGAYLLRRGLYLPWELPKILDPEMARQGLQDLQTIDHLNGTVRRLPLDAHRSRANVSALEMSWYMRNQLLRDTDWSSMAQSLEVRVPFLDIPLLKAVTPWLAAHPGISKPEIAAAMAPQLPAALINKPKTGFVVPVRDWLISDQGNQSERGMRAWAHYIYKRHGAARSNGQPSVGQHMNPQKKRVLITSISPGSGGVHTMTGFIVKLLILHGYGPVIAHYEPYSSSPHMSVPSFRLLQRTVARELRTAYGQCEAHAIGAWLPELEFTHYLVTPHWRQVMDSCEAFVMVSGNILAATPYWQTSRPYLAWVATDWEGDRKDRVQHFSWPRKWLDKFINGPVIRRLEKRLLKSGNILALSEYTAKALINVTGNKGATEVLPMPVNSELFSMLPEATIPGRIGFTGRFDDPRKNIGLLLATTAELKKRGLLVSALLIGGVPTDEIRQQVIDLGLSEQIVFLPRLSHVEMVAQLQSIDVFVLPSHQEGLCISALEAMSCGIPVVSTRCGGPEEFVINGQTGALVNADPHDMAQAIQSIVNDRALRARLSAGARRMIESRYTFPHAEHIFMNAFNATFPSLQES